MKALDFTNVDLARKLFGEMQEPVKAHLQAFAIKHQLHPQPLTIHPNEAFLAVLLMRLDRIERLLGIKRDDE